MDLREVAIEDDDVVAVALGARERRFAVVDDVDRHALAPQAHGDGGCELFVILDDEHAHPLLPAVGDSNPA